MQPLDFMHCRNKKLSAQSDLGFYAFDWLGPQGVPHLRACQLRSGVGGMAGLGFQ